MKYKINSIVLIILLLTACSSEEPLNPSESLENIPVIDFVMHKMNYDKLLSNRLHNYEISCDLYYNGDLYKATIRASGAGSRYHPKWSYRVRLNEGNEINGLDAFNLSAQIFDKTLMRTSIALAVYKQSGNEESGFDDGFPVFSCRHIFLRINGEDQGLYPMLELVEEPFLQKRNMDCFELYKAGFESAFSFEKDNHPENNFGKKIPKDDNIQGLIDMIHARDTSNVDDIFNSFGTFLDIDNYIKYHALTTLLGNSDAFKNNFFMIIQNPGGPFRIIPWDFDKCFDYEKNLGLFGDNELITKLLQNDSVLALYKKNIKEQLDTYFTEDYIFPIIDSLKDVLAEAYNMDPYLGKHDYYNLDEETEKLKAHIREKRQFFIENIDTLKLK